MLFTCATAAMLLSCVAVVVLGQSVTESTTRGSLSFSITESWMSLSGEESQSPTSTSSPSLSPLRTGSVSSTSGGSLTGSASRTHSTHSASVTGSGISKTASSSTSLSRSTSRTSASGSVSVSVTGTLSNSASRTTSLTLSESLHSTSREETLTGTSTWTNSDSVHSKVTFSGSGSSRKASWSASITVSARSESFTSSDEASASKSMTSWSTSESPSRSRSNTADSASLSVTPSASLTSSRSSVKRAPWIAAADWPFPVILTAASTASFILSMVAAEGSLLALERRLTVQPTAFDSRRSAWSAQCSEGLPTLPIQDSETFTLPVAPAAPLVREFVVDGAAFSSAVNTSSGTVFVVCTSDGFFAGVTIRFVTGTLARNASGSSAVVPASVSQFAAPWALTYTLSTTVDATMTDVFVDARADSSLAALLFYAVDDDVSAPGACSYTARVATFDWHADAESNTSAAAVVQSSRLSAVSAATLRLCIGGSPLLQFSLHLIHGITWNGATLTGASPFLAVVGSTSTVAPVEMGAASGASYLTRTAVVACRVSIPTGAVAVTESSTEQGYFVSVEGASGSFSLCLRFLDAPQVSGEVMEFLSVTVATLLSVDGVSSGSVASPAALIMLIGDSPVTQVVSLAAATASAQSLLEQAHVFLASRSLVLAQPDQPPAPVDALIATAIVTTQSNITSQLILPTSWSGLAGLTDAALCWWTAVAAPTPLTVCVTLFRVSVASLLWIGRTSTAALSTRSVVLAGEAGVTVAAQTIPSNLSSSGASDWTLGYVSGNSCASLSSAPSNATVTWTQLAPGLLFSNANIFEGKFCLKRTSQLRFAEPITSARFVIGAFSSLGNTTVQSQLLSFAGSPPSDSGLRSAPVAISGLTAADVNSSVAVLPCTASETSEVGYRIAQSSSGFELQALWIATSTPSVLGHVSVCWTSAHTGAASLRDYFNATVVGVGHQLLRWSSNVSVVPAPVDADATFVLLSSVASQRFPVTLRSPLSIIGNTTTKTLAFAVAAVASAQSCEAQLIAVSAAFIVNITSTSAAVLNVTLPAAVSAALEPSVNLCFGVVERPAGTASSVLLPFRFGTALLVRYLVSGPAQSQLPLFTTAGSLAIVKYATTVVTVAVAVSNTSLLAATTSAPVLTFAASASATCSSVLGVLATWEQNNSLTTDVALSLDWMLGDTAFLCARLTTANNAVQGYAWTRYSFTVTRISTLESGLTPVSFASAAELVSAPSEGVQSFAMLAASARTVTFTGQALSAASTWAMRMYLSGSGADCLNDAPDLVGSVTSNATSTTQLQFAIPPVSLSLTYTTVCLVGFIGSVPVPLYLHTTLRVVPIVSIGASSLSARQQGIVAVSKYTTALRLYSSGGMVDISSFELYSSNAVACGRGAAETNATFAQLPLFVDNGAPFVSLTGFTAAGTNYLCYALADGSAGRRFMVQAVANRTLQPLGVSITSIDLKLSGNALGSNSTLGSLVNATMEVKATGSLLSSANIYISASDLGTCDTATLVGTTAFGNSRVPVQFTGCSGSASSATLTAATEITASTPMKICLGISYALDVIGYSSLDFFDSGLLFASVQPDELYVVQNQSSTVSYLGSMEVQPQVGMRVGSTKVALAVIPANTVLNAEWLSVSPVSDTTGQKYVLTSGDGDSLFDFSTAAAAIQLRDGRFGYQYTLQFSVASGGQVSAVNSSTTELASCQSSLQWAKLYTTECTTCPTFATCDGTTNMVTAGSYWRASTRSTNFYSCGSPYMQDTCLSNTSTGTCAEGHTGPRCSVCQDGYGLASDYCVSCTGQEIVNAFIVIFAALASGLVLVVLVVSTLQCKKSDQFPIYIKLLLNHLTVSSTLGEFSQYLSSSLVTLFKIQRQVSRPSPAFAALSCTLNLSWYQQFVVVTVFPVFAAVLLVVIFFIRNVVRRVGELRRARYSESTIHRDSLDHKTLNASSEAIGFRRQRSFGGFASVMERRQKSTVFLDPEGDTHAVHVGKPSAEQQAVSHHENTERLSVVSIDAPPSPGQPPVNVQPIRIRRRDQGAAHGLRESPRSPTLSINGPLPRSGAQLPMSPDEATPPASDVSGQPPARSDSNHSTSGVTLVIDGRNEEPQGDGHGGMLVSVELPKDVDSSDDDEDAIVANPNLMKRRMTKELGLLEVHGAVARQQAVHLFAVVMVIVMFAAYPSIIEWCANVLRCDLIDVGEIQTDGSVAVDVRSYFFYDRSKLCTDDTHSKYTVAGIVLGMVYGFGTPLFGVVVYYLLKRPKQRGGVGFVDASRMFTFLIAGYRREVWWWEAAVMFRKLTLIYIVSFLRDAQQQTLCAFWAICVYFIAHVVVRPYEYEVVDRMERYSLAVICLTLNFSLAYQWVSEDGSTLAQVGFWALSIFLLVINCAIVAWMVKEILVEGTLKVQKLLYAKQDLIREVLHPNLAACILKFAYVPPETVEITTEDGAVVQVVPQTDVRLSADEQQVLVNAEDSGSDWSDNEEEFHIEEEPPVEVVAVATPSAAGLATPNSEALAQQPSRSSFVPPGVIQEASGAFASSPSKTSGTWGTLKTRLKSISSFGAFRSSSSRPALASSTAGDAEVGFVATAAAQQALADLESAVASRSQNVVGNLQAIIKGMQAHSETLIKKYTSMKEQLKQRDEEVTAMRKQNYDTAANALRNEEQLREHAEHLSELQEMALALRRENEELKEELQRLNHSRDRSASPTNHLRLVESLAQERAALLKRLAQQDMEHGGGAPAPAGTHHDHLEWTVGDRMRELTEEAEAQRQAAAAIAEAERQAQRDAIQAQLRQKREARMTKQGPKPQASDIAETSVLAPSLLSKLPTPRRQSHVEEIVQRVVEYSEDGLDDEATPNPFSSTSGPDNNLSMHDAAANAGAELGVNATVARAAAVLEGALADAIQARPNTAQQILRQPSMGAQSSAQGLAECFSDREYQAVESSEGKILLIKRRHPKLRSPQFIAPWGHPTWHKK